MRKFCNLASISPFVFLLLLLFCSISIFSAEIVMKDGSAFIGKIQEESDIRVKFQWKDKSYEIPRKDIASIDLSKNGSDTSYHYTSFQLKDGSMIKGIVAEDSEKEIMIKTDLGFIHLDKNKIRSSDAPESLNPILNPKYLNTDDKNWNHKIGFSIQALANGSPLGASNPATFGGAIYLEPAFFELWKFRPGFRLEYQVSNSNASHYSFLNQFFYFNRSFRIGESLLWDFYTNIGVGSSTVQYSGNSQRFSGTNPATYLEFGWQGLQYKSIVFRTGIRSTCIFESRGQVCNVGIELGALLIL
ncbi:LA_3334 family protein [Leptospira santarosai]|uniref:LA_3334 family protein n=1 Tax=Leptospira santarosai TaxID=28183 RepID=UPI0024AFD167|nr:hypothetical protein [Leptospira santarosai]MDI7175164.1 hypothetical protein [Leptospira santarosai]MDI7194809.1 hypothetical protein [Leptospira santarosai]MDO6399217.1 hypothetical protein [Leptospira santarosai]MDO6404650.1 hypothetical protein [Leptospira santarosai]